MRKVKKTDLATSVEKQIAELTRIQLLDQLHQSLKSEAYDDMPLDNEGVGQLEKIAPGIITAFSGNHNFTTGTIDENLKVVMEAVDAGRALKAGIVVAVFLLLYKVYSVMTNNPSFKIAGGSGGGGRGTSIYATKQNEEVHTLATQAQQAITEVQEIIPTVARNPLNREDDSPMHRAATNLVRVAESGKQQGEEEVDPYKEIPQLVLCFSDTDVPMILFAKEVATYNNFENKLMALLDLIDKNNGHSSLNKFIENVLAINKIYSNIHSGNVKQLRDSMVTSKLRTSLTQYILELANFYKLGNGNVESVDDAINGSSVSMAAREYVKVIEEGLTPMRNYDGNSLSDEEIFKAMCKDPKADNNHIYWRNSKLGMCNDVFADMLKESGHGFQEDSQVIAALLSSLTQAKTAIREARTLEDNDITEDELSSMYKLTSDVEAYLNLYTSFILKPIFLTRTRLDKVTGYLENVIEQFNKVIETSNKIVKLNQDNESI